MDENIAFAAIDIGTSQIKIGVHSDLLSPKFRIIDSEENKLYYGKEGEVQCSVSEIEASVFRLLKSLGEFLNTNGVNTLLLGLCGHVSSYIPFHKEAKGDKFAIWLDRTCNPAVEEMNDLLANGASYKWLGTNLPKGTNWLATKLFFYLKKENDTNLKYPQIADVIFYRLTRRFNTHFSSQVSVVHQFKRVYSKQMLGMLGLNPENLPEIHTEPLPLSGNRQFGLPANTLVFPGMADFYASFYGLDLKKGEGFIMGNTSEVAGQLIEFANKDVTGFMQVTMDKDSLVYGSTNTGGNIINWYLENILNENNKKAALINLTNEASKIHPFETPIFMPYLAGERAPLWTNELSASFIGLKTFHGRAHLFRAILESISFARRQLFEQITESIPEIIKIAGGSSVNELFNEIRASVLGVPLSRLSQNEIGVLGTIRYMMNQFHSGLEKPELEFQSFKPNNKWVDVYSEKYSQFRQIQELMIKNKF